jgi:hypothetical protein
MIFMALVQETHASKPSRKKLENTLIQVTETNSRNVPISPNSPQNDVMIWIELDM